MKIFVNDPRRIRQGLFHILGIIIILSSPVFCGPVSVKLHKVKPKCENDCEENGVRGNPFEIYPGASSGLRPSNNEAANEINIFENEPNEVVGAKMEDQYDIGKYSTICWIQIITTVEYVNGSEPKTINEYAISFETPSDIPDKYLDKTGSDTFYKNTKKSYVVPVEVIEKTDNQIVRRGKNITCASGPLYTRTILQFPNKNQKRLEIKVSPIEKSLSIHCNDTNTDTSSISTRLLPDESKALTTESIETKHIQTTVNILKNILNNSATTKSPIDSDNTQPRIDKSELINDVTELVIAQTTVQPIIDRNPENTVTTTKPNDREDVINRITKLLETNPSATTVDDDHIKEADKLFEHLAKILEDEKDKFGRTTLQPIATRDLKNTTLNPIQTTRKLPAKKGKEEEEPDEKNIESSTKKPKTKLNPHGRNEQEEPESSTEDILENGTKKPKTNKKLPGSRTHGQEEPERSTEDILSENGTKKPKTTKKLPAAKTHGQEEPESSTENILSENGTKKPKTTKKIPGTRIHGQEEPESSTEHVLLESGAPKKKPKGTKKPDSLQRNGQEVSDDSTEEILKQNVEGVTKKPKTMKNLPVTEKDDQEKPDSSTEDTSSEDDTKKMHSPQREDQEALDALNQEILSQGTTNKPKTTKKMPISKTNEQEEHDDKEEKLPENGTEKPKTTKKMPATRRNGQEEPESPIEESVTKKPKTSKMFTPKGNENEVPDDTDTEEIVSDKNIENVTKKSKTIKKLTVTTTTEGKLHHTTKKTKKLLSDDSLEDLIEEIIDDNKENPRRNKKIPHNATNEEITSEEDTDDLKKKSHPNVTTQSTDNVPKKMNSRRYFISTTQKVKSDIIDVTTKKSHVPHKNIIPESTEDECEEDLTESPVDPVKNKTQKQIEELTDKIIEEAKKRDPTSEVLKPLGPIDNNPEKEKLVENITMEILHDLMTKNSTNLPSIYDEPTDQTHRTVKKKLGDSLEDVIMKTISPATKPNKLKSVAEDEISESEEFTTVMSERKRTTMKTTKKDIDVPNLRITDIPEDKIHLNDSLNEPKNEEMLNDEPNHTTPKEGYTKRNKSKVPKNKSFTTPKSIKKILQSDNNESDFTEISEEILSEIPDESGYTSEPIKLLRKTERKVTKIPKKQFTTDKNELPKSEPENNAAENPDDSSEEIIKELPGNESIIIKKNHKKTKHGSKNQTTTTTTVKNEHVTTPKHKSINEEEDLENSQEKPEVNDKIEEPNEDNRKLLSSSPKVNDDLELVSSKETSKSVSSSTSSSVVITTKKSKRTKDGENITELPKKPEDDEVAPRITAVTELPSEDKKNSFPDHFDSKIIEEIENITGSKLITTTKKPKYHKTHLETTTKRIDAETSAEETEEITELIDDGHKTISHKKKTKNKKHPNVTTIQPINNKKENVEVTTEGERTTNKNKVVSRNEPKLSKSGFETTTHKLIDDRENVDLRNSKEPETVTEHVNELTTKIKNKKTKIHTTQKTFDESVKGELHTEKPPGGLKHKPKESTDDYETEEITELINSSEGVTETNKKSKKIKHRKKLKPLDSHLENITTTTEKNKNLKSDNPKDYQKNQTESLSEESDEYSDDIDDTENTTSKTNKRKKPHKPKNDPEFIIQTDEHDEKLDDSDESEEITELIYEPDSTEKTTHKKKKKPKIIKHRRKHKKTKNEVTTQKTTNKTLDEKQFETSSVVTLILGSKMNNSTHTETTTHKNKKEDDDDTSMNEEIDDQITTLPPKEEADASIATRLNHNDADDITIIPVTEFDEDIYSTISPKNHKKIIRKHRRKHKKPKHRTDKNEDDIENVSVVVITDAEDSEVTETPLYNDDSIATRLDGHEEDGITINPTIEDDDVTKSPTIENEDVRRNPKDDDQDEITEIPFIITTKKTKPRKWKRIHIRRRKPKGDRPGQTQIISEETLEDSDKQKTPRTIEKTTQKTIATTIPPVITDDADMPKSRDHIDSNNNDTNSINSKPVDNHKISPQQIEVSSEKILHDYITTKHEEKIETTTFKTKHKSFRTTYNPSSPDQVPEHPPNLPNEKEEPKIKDTEIDITTTEPPIYFEDPDTDKKKLQLEFIKELMRELETDITTIKPEEHLTEKPPVIAKGIRDGKIICYNVSKLIKKTKCPENTETLPHIDDIRNQPKTTMTPYLLKINKLEKLLDMLCTKKLNKLKEKLRKNNSDHDYTRIVKRETKEKILDQLKRFKRDLSKMNLDYIFNNRNN